MTEGQALTARQRDKADRRRALLDAAKRQMATYGYLGVRLDDIAGEAGISGPAVYRHFASKDAVLAALMVEISDKLRDGGRRVVRENPDPLSALRGLVQWQADFSTGEPELILIYDRDRFHMAAPDQDRVRRAQGEYVRIWVDVIGRAVPSGRPDTDRVRAHAAIGLINSAPRAPRDVSRGTVRDVIVSMALAALGVPSPTPTT